MPRTAKGPVSTREVSEKTPLIELNNTVCISNPLETSKFNSRRSSDLLIRIPVHRKFRQYNVPYVSPCVSVKNRSCYERSPKATTLNSETKTYNTQWANTRLKTAATINKNSKSATVSAERSRFTFKEYKDKYMKVYLRKGMKTGNKPH